MYTTPELLKKWAPMLDHAEMPSIKDSTRREVTCQVLENTLESFQEEGAFFSKQVLNEADSPSTNITGGISTYDPVLITLVRRALPNLIAYDICGVQPLKGPTGLIFALVPQYANQAGTDAFYNEPNTAFTTITAGNANTMGNAHTGTVPTGSSNTYNYAQAMATAQAESLGTTGNSDFAQMAVSIEKVTAIAKSRALKSEYTMEMAQDMKAIHGLSAETELANIVSVELLAEINREIVRTINLIALQGCATTTTPGVFDMDVDSNGRWSVEKFKGLMFQLERECNAVAKATRRGRGNILLCSSDVASALQMAGVLDYAPALAANALQVDDTGPTFAGVLNGHIRVYIDPYTTGDYVTVGYKGASAMDAGVFYAPYVPLQMVRAVNPTSMQPKIGFKTRYAVVNSPFSTGAVVSDGTLSQGTNVFYRSFAVNHLM